MEVTLNRPSPKLYFVVVSETDPVKCLSNCIGNFWSNKGKFLVKFPEK